MIECAARRGLPQLCRSALFTVGATPSQLNDQPKETAPTRRVAPTELQFGSALSFYKPVAATRLPLLLCTLAFLCFQFLHRPGHFQLTRPERFQLTTLVVNTYTRVVANLAK
jgi:hypothetical protein